MNGEVRQNGDIMARATAKFMEARISDSGLAPEVGVGQTKRRGHTTNRKVSAS
jgi:hypothetical protein